MLNAGAFDIADIASDIYILGIGVTSTSGAGYLWKNGAYSRLTPPSGLNIGLAYGLTLLGDAQFISGVGEDSSGNYTPGYWANGVFIALPLPNGAVSGTAAYCALTGN
jgi:hypothetical protein